MAIGISYVVIIAAYVVAGAPPHDAELWLRYLAGRQTAWWTIIALSVLTDLLFVPVAVSLYLALKNVNRIAMLVGSGFLVAFAVLDLAVTWPNYAALLDLSAQYASAGNDSLRMHVAVAAAHYPAAVLSSRLAAVYAILIPSLGNVIIGRVMLKGEFGKVTAYLAVTSGILGVVAVVGPYVAQGLGLAVVLGSILTTVWVFLAGYRLYRLGLST